MIFVELEFASVTSVHSSKSEIKDGVDILCTHRFVSPMAGLFQVCD